MHQKQLKTALSLLQASPLGRPSILTPKVTSAPLAQQVNAPGESTSSTSSSSSSNDSESGIAGARAQQQGGGDDGGVKAEAEASTSAAQTELGQHQKGDLLLDVLNKPITQDGDMLVGLGDYFVGKGQREAAAICFAQATALGAGAEDATRRKQALIQLKQGIQQINKEEKEA